MDLSQEYLDQEPFRAWNAMLDRLPLEADHTVLDLGCGPGVAASRLAERVRRVIGVDRDRDLLTTARRRCPNNCRFIEADLARPFDSGEVELLDGVWSSFAAAYFPRLGDVLPDWLAHLKPGAFVALVEVDDMFLGHRPLAGHARQALTDFRDFLLRLGAYDFDMGSKLERFATDAGLERVERHDFEDAELAFQGPASPDVVGSWRRRFARMHGLRDRLGAPTFQQVEHAFLECLADPGHACDASVVMMLARRPG